MGKLDTGDQNFPPQSKMGTRTETKKSCLNSDHRNIESENSQMSEWGKTLLKCKVCGNNFSNRRSLKRHMVAHTSQYKCDYCGKTFSINQHLTIHLRRHTGEKPFKCDHCGKTFSQNHHLTSHLRTHTGEKPFKCDHCGKTFSQNHHLTIHLRTHTGEKPYKCNHCGKTFSQNPHLTSHLWTHTGEKPFKCDHCGRTFSDKQCLSRHIKTHTGQKQHKCDYCGLAFFRKTFLVIHIRTHTGDKIDECQVCKKAFLNSSNLKRHTNIHTRENQSTSKGPEVVSNKRDSAEKQMETSTDTPDRFECDTCHRDFPLRFHLIQHKKKNQCSAPRPARRKIILNGSIPLEEFIEMTNDWSDNEGDGNKSLTRTGNITGDDPTKMVKLVYRDPELEESKKRMREEDKKIVLLYFWPRILIWICCPVYLMLMRRNRSR